MNRSGHQSMSFPTPKRYDAFLSYNSHDRAVVEELERRLRAEGLTLYLEVWELAP
ncbi:MAG: toll/interleukin-1 receptor domain-containing protein, partial [Terrimicrobiaceae bacterium]